MDKMDIMRVPRFNNKKNVGGYCYDDCIATITHNRKMNYEMMYANALSIKYTQQEGAFAQKINSSTFKENLFRFYGISQELVSDYSSLKAKINSGAISILIMDSFYIPWDLGYKKVHSDGHFFIVTNKIESKYVCIDPYYEIDCSELPEEAMIKGYISHINIEFMQQENKLDDLQFFLSSVITISDDSISDLTRFANDFELSFDFDKEIQVKAYGEDYPKLVDTFSHLEKNALKFRVAYDHIIKKYNYFLKEDDCILIRDEINTLSNNWLKAKGEVYKYSLSKKDKNETKKNIVELLYRNIGILRYIFVKLNEEMFS